MKRIIRLFGAALILAALVGGGLWYSKNHVAKAASTTSQTYSQTVAVKQGSLSSTISVVGQLEAVQSADLLFSKLTSPTVLATLTVKAGATITNGQVLATVDATPYQAALDQARTALDAAQKKLTDLTTAATALDIAQADVKAAKAQQTLAQAESDLADFNAPDLVTLQNAVKDAQDSINVVTLQISLAEHDSLAKSERDLSYSVSWYERRINELQAISIPNLEQTQELAKDKTTLATAQADLARVQAERDLASRSRAAELAKDKVALADAQEALATAQTGGDVLALAAAQVAVQDAKVTLQTAQKARTDLTTGADATDIATAKADVDKKKLAVSDAQAALAATKLTATFDGTVLKANSKVGDLVAANTIVLTIANLKTLQVSASVDETTIRQVSAGQAAVVSFDAFPNQTFKGSVASVPLQGTLQGGIMVYAVPITLTGTEKLTLLVGMTANVKIQAGTVQNGLLVPTMALTKSNGQYQVLVPSTVDAKADPVATPVEVGLSDGTYTQITKGLNVGDQVVVQVKSSTTNTSASLGGGNSIMSLSRLIGGR